MLWKNMTEVNLHEFPPEYQILVHQQNRIGWRHSYSGNFFKQWSIFMIKHLSLSLMDIGQSTYLTTHLLDRLLTYED